tara:strand:- start:594 stop:1004 length:411 start_codon:yes stop_codon:yes gene_type:complete
VTESALQALIVRWLDAALPTAALVHHSPNEGRRHVAFQKKLANLGTRWGWPDLELFAPPEAFLSADQWAPVFLEVKAAGGRMTENQEAVHRALRECRCQVATVRSLEDAESFLEGLLHLRTTGQANLLRQLGEVSA